MKIKHLLIIMMLPFLVNGAKAQTIFGEDFDTQLYLKWNTTTTKWDSSKLYDYIVHDTATVSGKWKYVIVQKDFISGAFVPKNKTRYNLSVKPPVIGFDSLTSYTWDPGTSSYSTWFRVEVTYNSMGKITSSKTYMKNPLFPGQPNEFLYSTQQNYFDGSGNQKGAIIMNYSVITTKLERTDSMIYTVDGSNNITNEIQLQYKNSIWNNYKQTARTFNSNNAEILVIQQNYNNNAWEYKDKVVTVYTGAMQTEKEVFGWVTSAWVPQRKTVTTYTGMKKTMELGTNWSTSTNAYVNDSRTSFYFATNGNRDSTVEEKWSTSGNSWDKSGKYLFKRGGIVVNTPAAPTNLQLVPMKVEVAGKMQLTWNDNSNNETGFVIQRSTDNISYTNIDSTGANVATFLDMGLPPNTVYYYRVYAYNVNGASLPSNTANATTTAISESVSVSERISVYPNPCSDHFVIESKSLVGNDPVEILVYNVLGRLVESKVFAANTQNVISMDTLSSGVYYVKIKVGDELLTRKLIVE
jgi:hypothetical protein